MTDFDVGTLQSVNSTIIGLQKQMDDLEMQVREKGKTLFFEEIKPLIDKYPFIGLISWTAYTPYFNDGDECVFHSHHEYPSFSTVKDVEDENEGLWEEHGEEWYSKSEESIHLGYKKKMGTNRWSQGREVDDYSQPITKPNENYDAQVGQADKEIREFLKQFNDNTMRALFGDHVLVKVTRTAVETSECEHD